MSSVIAVSVSLLGLSLAIFTLIIFIQMILSFPAMLSSNSQAYVQQQRKVHHISPRHDLHYYLDIEEDDVVGSWGQGQQQQEEEEEEEPFTRGRTLRRQGSRLDGALGCRQRQVNRM